MSSLSKWTRYISQTCSKAEAAFLKLKTELLQSNKRNRRNKQGIFGDHFNQNMRQLGNLVAVGSSGNQMMMLHLLNVFRASGRTRTDIRKSCYFWRISNCIEKLRVTQENHLAIRAGSAHIERVWNLSNGTLKKLF